MTGTAEQSAIDEHDDISGDAKRQPFKLRWTVPPVDVSVIEWLETQRNPQQSLRQLIRDSIQRDGYTDVYYKPVEQLPRRGRPPGDSASQDAGAPRAVDTRPEAMPEVYSPPSPAPAEPTPQEAPEAAVEASAEPVVQAAPVAPPSSAPAESGGQVDMDSIFSQRG